MGMVARGWSRSGHWAKLRELLRVSRTLKKKLNLGVMVAQL